MKSTIFKLLTLSSLALTMASCGGSSSSSSPTSITINRDTYYNELSSRVSFDEENSKNFNEDFQSGMSDEHFLTLDGAWHTDTVGAEHNGMRSRNLFYTNDGTNDYLAIKARGMYNKEDPTTSGKPEGGCFITKEHLGPGRYEIEMAAMPREGGVTAMWTYCTTTGSEKTSQNEIDIEIGGTTGSSQFKDIWFTSWTKKETKETNTVDVSDELYLNDGKIHKYTFDWYTNYNNQNIKRVDWFIDGIYYNSLEGNVVPEHQMPLWIGVWFPPLWAGNAAFDTDYMLVKNVSYKAFDSSQWSESCRSEPGYIKRKPSEAGIQTISFNDIKTINKFSNPDFENLDKSSRDNSYYGWKEDSASKGTVSLVNGNKGSAFQLTAGDESLGNYHGEYLKQTLTNAFEGYTFDLKIDAKLLNSESEGNIELYYTDEFGTQLKRETIKIESLDFQTITKRITMPANSYSLGVEITSEKGSVIYDNASLLYVS